VLLKPFVPPRLLVLLAGVSLAVHSQEVVFLDGFEFIETYEAGTYDITVESIVDPCEQQFFTGTPPQVLTFTRTAPGQYRVTGTSPWVTLNGTIEEGATGAAALSGRGTVAGFPNVLCSFTGTVLDGVLAGTVSWGDDNELPSGSCPVGEMDSSIKFIISGTRAE
jgi:hypothetical protein